MSGTNRTTLLCLIMALTTTMFAQAPASAVNVTGKWLFQVETGAGTGTPTVTFKQDGEKLTGHYSGQLGEADFTGTVKGQDITFSFTTNIQGYQLNITYTGTIQGGDSMKGKVSLGEIGEGTFTGKKQ